MAKKPGAGDLFERVGFDKHGTASDGAGGTISAFVEQFTRRAEFIHLRGGEAVLAARLQGRHTQIIRVRADSETRTVTTDWRISDKRLAGVVYNIRDITLSKDRAFLDMLCERGVAT
ncbi:phage head closure protein [Mesorhizobium sp. WSM2239]|uniref:Phage head closure protein n=2 Tax=unclassified Mesorhizobium TaxID=325217 RepID=A0AAU8D2H1_9HYPH